MYIYLRRGNVRAMFMVLMETRVYNHETEPDIRSRIDNIMNEHVCSSEAVMSIFQPPVLDYRRLKLACALFDSVQRCKTTTVRYISDVHATHRITPLLS